MIKKIGTLARKDLEAQLGNQVFLELFVKIEKDWSKDPKKVKELAYS
ncbi:MAG: KH domain-containing protein [Deltaproteobacteria bacterium]|nr:KH domain-containing protein [Deltaproteobacteria bacterium]